MGEDAELLPDAAGPVVGGRDDIEGELALQFGQGLLLGATPTHEGVQGGKVQGEGGRDGGVLVVAVVGGEQIELRSYPQNLLVYSARLIR